MLDGETAGCRREEAVPDAGRAIVGRHADDAGVVPELAVDELAERQAAVAGDHAVGTGGGYLAVLDEGGGGGEDEAVDEVDAAVDHGQTLAGDAEIDAGRQRGEPTAGIVADLAIRVGEPGGGEALAGATLGIAAGAVVGSLGELLVAVAHDDMDAGAAHEIDGFRRAAAIGDEVAGADDASARDAEPVGLLQDRLGCLQIAIGTPEDDRRSVDVHHLHCACHSRVPVAPSPVQCAPEAPITRSHFVVS